LTIVLDTPPERPVALVAEAQVVDRGTDLLPDAPEDADEPVVGPGRRAGQGDVQLPQRLVVQGAGDAPALGVADVADALTDLGSLDGAVEDVRDRPQEVDLVAAEPPGSA
jgi:hypothetical protein